MTIICGIDFSPGSRKAAEVAAAIGARRKEAVVMTHALERWPVQAHGDKTEGIVGEACRAVEREAQQLRGHGAEVRTRVDLDTPLSALAKRVREEAADLVVVGSSGAEVESRHGVGRTADHLAQHAQVPTLVVRHSEPLEKWLRGEKVLTVVVGLDFNAASDQAWRWALALRRLGQVRLVGVHVYWPPEEFHRLGLSGMRSYVDDDPEVERVLRREVERRFPADGEAQRVLSPSIGRRGDHLLAVAAKHGADLVVLGSHGRSAIQRLWEGSVARNVLHYANASVALVPSTGLAPPTAVGSQVVLAATDFSPEGDAAVAKAFGQVGPGGVVHLVHVIAPRQAPSVWKPHDIFAVSPDQGDAQRSIEDKLKARLPISGFPDERRAEVHVLESAHCADAIVQAAERVGAEIICIGTHGRGRLANAVLGSVAQGVLQKTERAVLLVRAARK